MRTLHLYVLLLSLLVLIAARPTTVQAAATLQSAQPLYTTRDNQVALIGSGLTPGVTYYVWVRTPGANRTRYTGTSFLPVTGGLMPPGIAYPLNSTLPLGTYLVSLSTSSSTDNSQATAHFGVWGTTQPLYQRTQSVSIMGGGLYPGISFKLDVRDPAGNFVHQATLASTTAGSFNNTWRLPEDSVTDVYTIFIDGTGIYDNPQQDFVSQSKFTVTQAVLAVKVTQQPNPSYQRTQQATVSLSIQYPDGSPVLKSKSGITPALLLQNQNTVAFASLNIVDTVNGIWTASSKILVNATASDKYRFEMPAMSFDDSYGNKGGSGNVYSSYFQVRNASLVVASEVNGTRIQVPFGQVSIISRVSYPDGTALTNGTVSVVVSTGNEVSTLASVYDPTIGAWRGSYSSTLSDVLRPGTWRLNVTAYDAFGNSGALEVNVQAQPYLFIAMLAVVIVIVLFARWIVSRYGRRVYFRTRKLLHRIRPGMVG